MSAIWNNLTQAARKRLLSEAGYSKSYSSRTFEGLPYWLKRDVEYTYKLKGA